MKKFLLTLFVILLAYLTAYYTSGASDKQDLFDFGNSVFAYKLKCAFTGETDTTDANDLYYRAEEYIEIEDYELALKDLKKVVILDPTNIQATLEISNIYLITGDTASAINSLHKYANESVYRAEAYIELGKIYEKLGSKDSAVYYYNKSATEDPSNSQVYSKLAMFYYKSNSLDFALENINKSIDLYNYDLDARNLRRLIYLKQNKMDEAQSEYDFIVQTDGDYFGNYEILAKEAAADNEHQKAVEYYKLSLLNQPNSRTILEEKAWQYHKLRAYDSALIDFKVVVVLYPDYLSYFNYAYTLDLLDSVEQAVENYGKSIEFKSDYYLTYNNRGYEYYRLKKFKKSEADYTKSIELKPDYYLHYYNRGGLYYNQKKYKKAIQDYKNALVYAESGLNILYDMALTYDKLKDSDAAVYNFNEFLKLVNESDTTRINYAVRRVSELSGK